MHPVLTHRQHKTLTTAMLQKLLLFCGLFSSLWYVAVNIIVPMYYPGYSVSSQTVSELSAIDTPTRTLWVVLCIFYTFLVIAFGWGIWMSASKSRRLRNVAVLLIADAIIGIFWPPMHRREVIAAGGGTLTDTLHIAFTFIHIPIIMLVIAFGASAFGKHFRFYSIATIIVMIVSGFYTGLDSPNISKNLPTPWIGIWERIIIGVYMIWFIVFAILLLEKERTRRMINA